MTNARASKSNQDEKLTKTTKDAKDILNEIQRCVRELGIKEKFNGDEPRELRDCYNKLAAVLDLSLDEDDSRLWHDLYQCVCGSLAPKYLAARTNKNDIMLDKDGNEPEKDLSCSGEMPVPEFEVTLGGSNNSICRLEEVSDYSNSSFNAEFYLGGDEITEAINKAKELKQTENPSLRSESRSRSRSPRSSNSIFKPSADDNSFQPLSDFGIVLLDDRTNNQEMQAENPVRMLF